MKINSSIYPPPSRLPHVGDKRDTVVRSVAEVEVDIVRESPVTSHIVSQRQNDQLRYAELIERNPQSKTALQSYLNNGPRIAQDLYQQVLGIDTYV